MGLHADAEAGDGIAGVELEAGGAVLAGDQERVPVEDLGEVGSLVAIGSLGRLVAVLAREDREDPLRVCIAAGQFAKEAVLALAVPVKVYDADAREAPLVERPPVLPLPLVDLHRGRGGEELANEGNVAEHRDLASGHPLATLAGRELRRREADASSQLAVHVHPEAGGVEIRHSLLCVRLIRQNDHAPVSGARRPGESKDHTRVPIHIRRAWSPHGAICHREVGLHQLLEKLRFSPPLKVEPETGAGPVIPAIAVPRLTEEVLAHGIGDGLHHGRRRVLGSPVGPHQPAEQQQ